MFHRLFLSVWFLLAAGSAMAQDVVQGLQQPLGNVTASMAAIDDFKVLVRKSKTIKVCDGTDCIDRRSDLRVSSVLLSGGPSTDVSPRYEILLLMNNEVEEHAVAFSSHRIAFAEELRSVERLKAGIYRYVYVTYDYSDDCFMGVRETTVDARQLSAAVRQAKRTSFFSDAFYDDPIYLTHKALGCLN